MEDELWMRKIKERLEDYSEPLPASGWKRLEDALSASRPPLAARRRAILFRRWATAAAAVLLVAVSSVNLWLLQSPTGEEVRRAAVPSLAKMPDNIPVNQLPDVQAVIPKPVYEEKKHTAQTTVSRRTLMAQQIPVFKETEEKKDITEVLVKEEVKEKYFSEEESRRAVEEETHEVQVMRRRPSGRDKLSLPVERKTVKSRGWSVGLSVGNSGGLTTGNDAALNYPMQDSSIGANFGGKIDFSQTANGILSIPQGEELVFKNGLPYLQKRGPQIASIDHKQPLSFGLSVRKGLAKGFSIETGLMYTYLASDIRYEGSNDKVSQKLHYIGIPLRANWNFVDKKAFIMYVSGGGAVEKCVYGKVGSEDETVKPLQFSVMGAVGAQYNISNRVGLYVEPGVAYFFDDGAEIETIRKENPCNFTLQGGIRLTY